MLKISEGLPTLLTPDEVSAALRLSPALLREMRGRNEGPAYVLITADEARYPLAELEVWLAERRVQMRNDGRASRETAQALGQLPEPPRVNNPRVNAMSRASTHHKTPTPMPRRPLATATATERQLLARIAARQVLWAAIQYPEPLPATAEFADWRCFGFSPRLCNLLFDSNVLSLDDLLSFARQDLTLLPGFGVMISAELRFHVARLRAQLAKR